MVAGRGTLPGHGQRRDGRGDEAARCRRRGASRRRGRMNQASTRSANGGGGARRLLQLMHSSEAQQAAHATPENKQPASAGDQPARREPAGHRANLSRAVELEEKRCFGEGEGMRPSNTC
ncbi:uncharacterized protein [Zea mays]|uniref:uncharacterized protein n=1 Tax=Zea mays TaxID=4577 RepID=UPI0004DE9FC8|nr:uncharacterized protein LOC103632217 [Zea mays]|eukprot:XP_008652260.1 uncharacterized protein LOC103632217 [Zea mays]